MTEHSCLRYRAACVGGPHPRSPQGQGQEGRAESAAEWEAVCEAAVQSAPGCPPPQLQTREGNKETLMGWLFASSSVPWLGSKDKKLICICLLSPLSLTQPSFNIAVKLPNYFPVLVLPLKIMFWKTNSAVQLKAVKDAPIRKPQKSLQLPRDLIVLKKTSTFHSKQWLHVLRLALLENCHMGWWFSPVQSCCWMWKSNY